MEGFGSRPDARGAPEEEPLLRIALRRLARRVRIEAATPRFTRLLLYQASGAAGDALVALALAGSLFFSVPEAAARERVALYLALTVAPFAIVAPFLSRFLDRHGGGLRAATTISSLGRALLAWLLATRLDGALLYPIAFGLLLFSRASLVVRGAVLPKVVPPGRPLVAANASLSKAGALAGIVALPVGVAVLRVGGDAFELVLAAVVFALGVVPALRLPSDRGRRSMDQRVGARAAIRSASMRQAIIAMAGMRLLVGFLVFHLAFVLRRVDVSSISLGVLVGVAAGGALLGAVLAPRLRRRLKEEGILAASLACGGVAALGAGRWFSVAAAGGLVLAFGIASGAAKVAFDSIVQRDTPEAARGWAFARFESLLQVMWVAGGLVPLVLTVGAEAGLIVSGAVANAVAILYVIGRRRVRPR
ncbi:MAG: MFS transporter, partial [Actinomycetota bacterium]